MNSFKILLVEDTESDIEICRSSAKVYGLQNSLKLDIVTAKTLAEAKEKIDNSFDGAIVDLKLSNEKPDEGVNFIQELKTIFRIPVVIFTGTPANAGEESKHIRVYKKGEVEYAHLFERILSTYKTGVTRILGGRGIIEETINKVFWNSILPSIENWEAYVTLGKETEKALLRFTINHLLEILEETDPCYPEEMYIHPLSEERFKTGQIIKKREGDYFIILSPACDLVVHKGNLKTEMILVCEIERLDFSLAKKLKGDIEKNIPEDANEENKQILKQKQDTARFNLYRLTANSYSNHLHHLPKTTVFKGGFINFRKLNSYKPSDIKRIFEPPVVQISTAFTKDIIARFSSYYARQGQPDFDFDSLSQKLLDDLSRDSA